MNYQINLNPLKTKMGKGLIAIFFIKCIFWGGIFVIQSCTKSINLHKFQELEIALKNFKEALDHQSGEILNLNQNLLTLKGTKSSLNESDSLKLEKDAKEALKPLVDESLELIEAYGLDLKELEYELDSIQIPEIALVGMALLAIEEEEEQLAFNYEALITTPVYANDLYDCALRSLGISALTEAFDRGIRSTAGKRMLKKAIVKVARRALGWIGAAWAAYEFGDCMDWW